MWSQPAAEAPFLLGHEDQPELGGRSRDPSPPWGALSLPGCSQGQQVVRPPRSLAKARSCSARAQAQGVFRGLCPHSLATVTRAVAVCGRDAPCGSQESRASGTDLLRRSLYCGEQGRGPGAGRGPVVTLGDEGTQRRPQGSHIGCLNEWSLALGFLALWPWTGSLSLLSTCVREPHCDPGWGHQDSRRVLVQAPCEPVSDEQPLNVEPAGPGQTGGGALWPRKRCEGSRCWRVQGGRWGWSAMNAEGLHRAITAGDTSSLATSPGPGVALSSAAPDWPLGHQLAASRILSGGLGAPRKSSLGLPRCPPVPALPLWSRWERLRSHCLNRQLLASPLLPM